MKSITSPFLFTNFVIASSAFFSFSSHCFASFIASVNSSIALSSGTSPLSNFFTIVSNFSKFSSNESSFSSFFFFLNSSYNTCVFTIPSLNSISKLSPFFVFLELVIILLSILVIVYPLFNVNNGLNVSSFEIICKYLFDFLSSI